MPRNTRFRLPARLPSGVGYPLGSSEKFQSLFHTSFQSPRLNLAHYSVVKEFHSLTVIPVNTGQMQGLKSF